MDRIKKTLFNRLVIILLFVGSLLSFYLLNHYTDLAIDDFGFKFIKSFDLERTYCRVTNLSELIESQTTHYLGMNGRVLANGLAQLFLITENKTWFNIANTIMFGLLQVLILLLSGFRLKELTVMHYLVMITSLWFLVPGPNQTFLWLDGSFNYLWVAVLVLAFIYLFSRMGSYEGKLSWHYYPVLFLAGFLAGAGHEVISIGVAGACCLYLILNKQKITGSAIALVSGFCLGTAFVILAPGNMARMESEGVREATFLLMLAQRIWAFFLSARSMIALILLIGILIFIYLRNKVTLSGILKGNAILLYAIPISLLFIIFAGSFQERVFFGVALFSIIVILSILKMHSQFLDHKIVWILTGFLATAMVVEYTNVAKVLRENKEVFDNDEKMWMASDDNVFIFRDKKTNRFVSLGLGEYDRFFWQNMVMSKYYGKEYMIFLPHDLYYGMYLTDSIVRDGNQVLSCFCNSDSTDYAFYRQPGSGFIVMPVDEAMTDEFGKGAFARFVPVEPVKVQNLDIRQKITRIIYSTEPAGITEEVVLCFSIRTDHGSYLYLRAPVNLPLKSIKAIQIHRSEDSEDPYLNLESCIANN
jgi:hypothetical protein